MKNRILIFPLYIAYWYLLFVAARIVFLLTYHTYSSQLTVYEIFSTFIYGFRLDISIASYISLIPSIFLTFTTFSSSKFIKYLYNIYTGLAVFFTSIILLGDLFMYSHWGFRIDATPLMYMTNLRAMTASVSIFTVIGGILAVFFLSVLLYIIYLKVFSHLLGSLQKQFRSFFILLILTISLILPIRGGIGIASLGSSSAYFSKKQFANHAAINPIWNVGLSLTLSNELNVRFAFFSGKEMKRLLSPLQSKPDHTIYLLNTTRPNIILIITESLTAKAVEETGGRPGIMPQLNSLIHEGVLFDQIYAASDRTDKGMAAVLSGYPSLPGSSPLKFLKLTEKLNFLPEKLNSVGYKSEFYYGGTLEFANYKSFLVQSGFDKMVSDIDFKPEELKSKWGAFDHVVLNRCLKDTPDDASIFFKTILTLTSHEPFITPEKPVFTGTDDETKYLNSLHYTDAAIGNFIKTAKTRKWWKNTLVIIIADHGSRRPGNSENWEKDKYHIPMIWLGGALNVKDTIVKNLACQTDLAATLLSQLNINANGFMFSKNILTSDYYPYSFFTYTDGFGFQKPDTLLIYNTVTNTYNNNDHIKDSLNEKQGKAYLQSLYLDFIGKNK